MNIENLLYRRNTIYGFCAIWIVLFHIFRKISMPFIPVISNFISIGNMGVDVFFFFSGLCLSRSTQKRDYVNNNWNRYYKRRLSRIIIPYLIICVPFYLWSSVFEKSGTVLRRIVIFFANLFSVTFWLTGKQTTWFVFGIIVFYLLFPKIYVFLKNRNRKREVYFLFLLVLLAVISSHIPIVDNSMLLWARLPVFTVGIIAGIRNTDSICTKCNTIISISVLLILGALISISEFSDSFTVSPVIRLLLYLPMSLALLTLISKSNYQVKFLQWIGNLSLEVYLIHITLLHPIQYHGYIPKAGYWLYLILPVITLILSWLVKIIEKLLLERTKITQNENIQHI